MDNEKNQYEKVYSTLIIVGGSKGITINSDVLKAMDCDVGDSLEVYIKKRKVD